ncbi:hypothetical protein AB0C34_30350 [Nocardia sp. NPDC049220]|uniref:hypothetical protein n=1 Tax=Nocardia sp. NPDC049220 TaxID=3155273 RepID=UPI0033D8437E
MTKNSDPPRCEVERHGAARRAVTDTGGHGIPVVYCNGLFATQGSGGGSSPAARGVGPGATGGLVLRRSRRGAVVAAHWASRNPDRAVGAILVDGAFPYDWLDEAMER